MVERSLMDITVCSKAQIIINLFEMLLFVYVDTHGVGKMFTLNIPLAFDRLDSK